MPGSRPERVAWLTTAVVVGLSWTAWAEASLVPSTEVTLEPSTSRPAAAYRSFEQSRPDPEICRSACAWDRACRAFTWHPSTVPGAGGDCLLASTAAPAEPDPGAASGVRRLEEATAAPEGGVAEPQRVPGDLIGDSRSGQITGDLLTVELNAEISKKSNSIETTSKLAKRPFSVGLEPSTNRFGSDYAGFDLAAADPEGCRATCAGDDACRAYTYVKPGIHGSEPRCYLKNAVPPATPDDCCVSGEKSFRDRRLEDFR